MSVRDEDVEKVVEGWALSYRLGTAVAAIARAVHGPDSLADLTLARRCLDREIGARAAMAPQAPKQIKPECPICDTPLARFRATTLMGGVRSSVEYHCGHVFCGDALQEALLEPARDRA